MENRANYIRVGVFTLLVILAAFGFVYWAIFASSGSTRVPLIVRIEGSVTGLQQGSQVLFNGLPVGVVRSLRIDSNNPNVVIATSEVDPTIPVKESTRANIGFAGLTGQAFISLQGGAANEMNIVQEAMEEGTVPVIRADPSDVTDILATARDISDRANNILATFEDIVTEVGPAIESTVKNVASITSNVDQLSEALSANSDDVDNFLASLGGLAETASEVAVELPPLIQRAETLLAAVDPAEIGQTVANVNALTGNLREQSENLSGLVASVQNAAASVDLVARIIDNNSPAIDSFLANLAPLSENANQLVTRLGGTAQTAETLIASVDPGAVSSTVASLQATTGNLAAFSEGLGGYSERVDEILSAAVSSLNGVQQVVQTIAGRSEEVDSLLANLGPISTNIRTASENVGEASEGLQATVANANQLLASVDPQTVATSVDYLETTLRNAAAFSNGFGLYQERIGTLVNAATSSAENVRAITDTVAGRSEEVDSLLANLGPISANVRVVSENASEASQTLQETVANANRLVSTVNPEQVSSVIDNLATAMTNVSEVTQTLSQNRERISTTLEGASNAVANVQAITSAVVERIDDIDSALASLQPVAANIERSSADLGAAAQQARELVASVDAGSINRSLSNIEGVTGAVNARTGEIESIVEGVDKTVSTLNRALLGFEQSRARVDLLLQAVQPERINNAVANVSDATENVARAADSIAGVADVVGERREDIDGIITDTRATAAQLAAASRQIDGVVQSIDRVLKQTGGFLSGAGDGSPLGADLAATLRSIRDAAQSVQAQVDPISASIRGTSDQGIREFRELARSLSQSVERIQRSISDVSSNPGQLLFGGEGNVKTYDGRTRR